MCVRDHGRVDDDAATVKVTHAKIGVVSTGTHFFKNCGVSACQHVGEVVDLQL